MTQEALKLALADAKRNERHNNVAETRYWLNQYKLIAEQAIAELESQEPVAYINVEKRILEWAKLTSWETPTVVNLPKIPLYTHPPQRTWVGLTDDEVNNAIKEKNISPLFTYRMIARTIESKLRQKNT